MKLYLSILASLFAVSAIAAQAPGAYPMGPDETLTPGSLCESRYSKRYPEGIAYCSRDVKSERKREVMETYDERLGYRVTRMQRSAFKIDHYIPLCMGGSNSADNLWPQHQEVFTITDPLEQIACQKMAKGVLKQAEAIELIKRAKGDLSTVPEILAYVGGL